MTSPTIRASPLACAEVRAMSARHGIPLALCIEAMLDAWVVLPVFVRAHAVLAARDHSGPWVNVTRVRPALGMAFEVGANAASVEPRNFTDALVRAWGTLSREQQFTLTTKRPKPGTIMARILARLHASPASLAEMARHLFRSDEFEATRRTSVHLDKMRQRKLVTGDGYGRWTLTDRGRWLAARSAADAPSTPKRPKGRT
jgi:hypothetical protein